MNRISITFELCGDRRYDAFFLRLRHYGASPKLPAQWVLLTAATVHEIRRDLQTYIDPADRLLVTQVGSMSHQNPINEDFGMGAA